MNIKPVMPSFSGNYCIQTSSSQQAIKLEQPYLGKGNCSACPDNEDLLIKTENPQFSLTDYDLLQDNLDKSLASKDINKKEHENLVYNVRKAFENNARTQGLIAYA
jgi:hypothetical protein